MFTDYQAVVLRAYEEKKAAGALSSNLLRLTTANLKKECIDIFPKRNIKRDEFILSEFFGEQADANAYISVIKKTDADRFKPLYNLLKGKIESTREEKHINLLAWLIDFEHRPHRWDGAYNKNLTVLPPDARDKKVETKPDFAENNAETQTLSENQKADSLVSGTWQTVERKKTSISAIKRKAVLAGCLLILLAGSLLLLQQNSILPFSIKQPEHCMYWNGSQYEPISCNATPGDKTILAMDTFKIVHFKKIQKPDTLTSYSIGKVWYVKYNNSLELYTAGGFDPVHADRRLKPLTAYMLNKYFSLK